MARTPPLNPNLPMVDPKTGNPTPFFMRWWQDQVTSNALITDLSTPAAVAAVLDTLGTAARGDILFRGASLWEYLTADTAGKVLSTNGPGADPSWETISQLLDDTIGSTRGGVLYRGASSWALLTPGTSGDFLQTQGASADPVWATASGGGGGGSSSFVAARYWRLKGTIAGTFNGGALCEIEMYSTVGGSDVTTGGTPISGSEAFGGTDDQAFDGDKATSFWAGASGAVAAGTSWVGYDFGSGNDVEVRQFELTARDGADANQIWDGWNIEYSDDGTNWTILQVYSDTASWSASESRKYLVPGVLNSGPASFAKANKVGNTLTAYNSGTPTENAHNATYNIWRIHHTTNQGTSFALKTGLADGDTVILKTKCLITGSNFHSMGLVYGEASSNKRVLFGLSFGGSWRKQFWNNHTFVSETTITPAGVDSRYVNVAPWLYFKASRSGTNITVEYSFNGLFWYPLGTGTTTENSMSDVDLIGIGVNTTSSTGQTNYIELWGFDTSQQDEYGT